MIARNAVGFGKLKQCAVPHNSAEVSIWMRGRATTDDIVVTDSCLVVPEVVDLCSTANKASVFVSNTAAQSAMTKTLSGAIKESNASLVSVMQVPKSKNAADRYIAEHVCNIDIVVCDDLSLTRACVNKGATVVDSYGRVFNRNDESETMTLAQIREIRNLLGPKKKKSKQRRKELFYESLARLLEAS